MGIERGLDIARRRNTEFQHIHKYGSNPELALAIESVWSAGGLYPWSALDTPQTLYCISTDAADTGVLWVEGLDSTWNLQSEFITLTGLTAATSANTYQRVYRMRYIAGENAGTITARTVSGAGTVVAQIDIEKGQTLMAMFTVPVGYIGYLLNYTLGTGKGDDATVDLFTRKIDVNGFLLKSEAQVFQSSFTQDFEVPLVLTAKTDIDFRAVTTNAGSKCTLNYDILLEKI